MSRKTLAWANKEVETFRNDFHGSSLLNVSRASFPLFLLSSLHCRADMMSRCFGSCRCDRHPTYRKGTVGGGNATSELSWAKLPPPYRTEVNRTERHPPVEKHHKVAALEGPLFYQVVLPQVVSHSKPFENTPFNNSLTSGKVHPVDLQCPCTN